MRPTAHVVTLNASSKNKAAASRIKYDHGRFFLVQRNVRPARSGRGSCLVSAYGDDSGMYSGVLRADGVSRRRGVKDMTMP